MEELVKRLETRATEMAKYLDHYYGQKEVITHGQWEDSMRLLELQTKIVELKMKLQDQK